MDRWTVTVRAATVSSLTQQGGSGGGARHTSSKIYSSSHTFYQIILMVQQGGRLYFKTENKLDGESAPIRFCLILLHHQRIIDCIAFTL